MAIGDSGKYGWDSCLGVAEETTFGTHVTATAFFEFNSESMVRNIDELRLDTINCTRDYNKRVQTVEYTEGTIEAPLDVSSDAIMYLMKQCFGGTVATAAISAGAAYAHTFYTGDMESNQSSAGAADTKSLSMNIKKGGTIFDFNGNRVNNMTISGTIGEPVTVSFDVVGRTATTSADSLTVAYSNVVPLMFDGITISNAGTTTSLPGTTETFTGFELSFANNIDNGDTSRALGSRLYSILPPIQRDVTLTLNQRFDTTTAWNRFVTGSALSFRINLGSSVSLGAATTYSMYIDIHKAYHNSNTPTVGDKGILMYDIPLSTVRETSTSQLIQAVVSNATANY